MRNHVFCLFYLVLPVAPVTPIGAAPGMRASSAAPPPLPPPPLHPPTPAAAPGKR